jgi:lysophospholipase L1-like esterase
VLGEADLRHRILPSRVVAAGAARALAPGRPAVVVRRRRRISAVAAAMLVTLAVLAASSAVPATAAMRARFAAPAKFVAPAARRATARVAQRSGRGRDLLALGDSLAAGYQPVDGSNPPPTDRATGLPVGYPGGYAADLAAALQMSLVDLGCPGETTASMTGRPARAGCAAAYRHGLGASSQLAAARAFLARERGKVALVTIDLGANDIDGCLARGASLDASCLDARVAQVARRLPAILAGLRQALQADDPAARLVGMDYYDPFLGLDVVPGSRRASAEAFLSLVVVERYDAELAAVYRRAGVQMADVFAGFGSARSSPLVSYGSRRLSFNVSRVCALTWMCPLEKGISPDIHPNAHGYRVIASAFEQVLGRS